MDETRTACPTDEALFRFFRREADRGEVEACADHVRACPRCRLRLEGLRAVEAEIRPRQRHFISLARRSQREQRAKPAPTSTLARRRWAPAAVAFVLIAASAAVYLLLRPATSTDEVWRSGRSSGLRLIEPAEQLDQAPTVFRWEAVPGTKGYLFELIDNALNTIVPSTYVVDPWFRLTPEIRSTLKSGRAYVWSVKIHNDDALRKTSAQRSFIIRGR